MKITKEEFADKVIDKYKTEPQPLCPADIGLKDSDFCLDDNLQIACLKCWQQAIEQGVES